MNNSRHVLVLVACFAWVACATTGPVYENPRTAGCATFECWHPTGFHSPNDARAKLETVDGTAVAHGLLTGTPSLLDLTPGAHRILMSLEAPGWRGAASVDFAAEANHAYQVIVRTVNREFEVSLWDNTATPGKLLKQSRETAWERSEAAPRQGYIPIRSPGEID